MKKLLITLGAVVALTATAGAADLPARIYTKAPAVIASPMYDWSGFYIGINGGGGSAHKCWDLVNDGLAPVSPPLPEGCHNATGGTVGGEIGYRWQAINWVFGLEAQGNWANFKGRNVDLQSGGTVYDATKIDAFGLFTGQVGYAWNNVLLYVKGGVAVVRDKYTIPLVQAVSPRTFAGQLFAIGSETRWGGTAGAGLEVGFAPNWSVGVEYDHLFMGTRDVSTYLVPPFVFGTGLAAISRIRQDVDVGTVRLNYRFGGPLVAKY